MGEDKEEGQPYSQEVQAGHGGGHGRRGEVRRMCARVKRRA